ncbi:precorrin-6y C5,15-methyltransferase (decarboxylating) subunit CbiE [Chelatococcus asaccharovorans]|uniref:precorrin-6y C5,15-methyltransferase (decarboxylating) subunit CbiE n=1 Tax=Chelatococcus asaccharovorans TaxID=28210 RepID=UPI00224C697C|nr:precorrin-6y C5,15-methyltransferase (decarboxylating) subunit CbiE [Chelatococcus asaccharovorans]CAH1663503.1 Precorrin-6Y C(5,15)-methyltransferase (decarboxylating) [Chelatococcus asaccharovorans]CAH1682801.1 Precorrin-6Y C(5,15)-methyltransferase (decarboxylating) [Chelatococcus asaccharovorans]
MSARDILSPPPVSSLSSTAPWLAIVGVGEDGLDGLNAAARRFVEGADLVVGGQRHLALAAPLVKGEALVWPSPIHEAFPAILARRGTPVCVLASGDPFCFGIGSVLAQHVPPAEFTVMAQPSAFSLAAARLGWALQDVATISLHGRPLARIRPLLQPGARILALAWDGTTPAKLAALLREGGFGASRITMLECLGGPRERIRTATAADFAISDSSPLVTIALEVVAGREARVIPLAPGLDDGFFAHDGQITKREIRALALSALAPRQGELLWDVGAGSGSVGIEWMLRHPSLKAIAIEAKEERAARIRANAEALGVPDLAVVRGEAPAALAGLTPPSAIFIGGGASRPGVIEACWQALPEGGRLVVHAVTLETETLLTGAQARYGGDLLRCALERAEPIGRFRGWRAAMPVMQWRVEKRCVSCGM